MRRAIGPRPRLRRPGGGAALCEDGSAVVALAAASEGSTGADGASARVARTSPLAGFDPTLRPFVLPIVRLELEGHRDGATKAGGDYTMRAALKTGVSLEG
jgi:hypothetical protein